MPKQSNFKTLLEGKIKEITRTARNSPERKEMPWFRRGEVMVHLAKAIEHKADKVILDGQMFDVSYKDNRVTVRPSDGTFVPCAHLNAEEYLEDYGVFQRAHEVKRLDDQAEG